MILAERYIPAFWYSSNNFGDNVTHYLIKKISGKTPLLVTKECDVDKVVVTGSILNNDIKRATIWGSGIANESDPIPNHNYLAVRGKLLHDRVTKTLKKRKLFKDDIAVGDPVMLLPRYYNNESVVKTHKLGIIPHYIEAYDFVKSLEYGDLLERNNIKLIDINLPVEQFVDEILSCENILSSTLHGIICADAYGIPAARFTYSNKISGDGFKYLDWFSNFQNRISYLELSSGVYLTDDTFKDLINDLENKNLYKKWLDVMTIDLDFLYEKCPFKP